VDAATRDAARDAGNTQLADTGTTQTAPDSGSVTTDAGSDNAGAITLRKRICGDTATWPAPLPQTRTASRVGTEQFDFIEGPVWIDALGVLLFSDMNFGGGNTQGPPSRIRRLQPPATFDVLVESANSNGLALTLDGKVIAATHDTQSLSLFDPASGARTKLDVKFDGKRFYSPNDLTVRSDGTVYFSDPDWQLGDRSAEIGKMGVYRVSPPVDTAGPHAAILVDDTLDKPNGVLLSPDEQTLYVGSSGSELWKFPVNADGSLGGRTKFADVGASDGMGIDCAGNVYVASETVEVFAPSGTKLGEITTNGSPSNVAFGGTDHKTLYITSGSALFSIELMVPGFPY